MPGNASLYALESICGVDFSSNNVNTMPDTAVRSILYRGNVNNLYSKYKEQFVWRMVNWLATEFCIRGTFLRSIFNVIHDHGNALRSPP